MDSSEREMNPIAMTIINPQKEYWPSRGSNQQPPAFKSAMLLTELWGLADLMYMYKKYNCTPAKQMFSGVYWNQPVCQSLYPSVNKILVSVKVLAGVLSRI